MSEGSENNGIVMLSIIGSIVLDMSQYSRRSRSLDSAPTPQPQHQQQHQQQQQQKRSLDACHTQATRVCLILNENPPLPSFLNELLLSECVDGGN